MIQRKNFLLGMFLAVCGLYAVAVSDLIGFKPGDPIKSSDVNQNFGTLKSAIQALEAPGSVSGTRLADGAVTLSKLKIEGKAAEGMVLKYRGDALTWDDDLSSTGTPYSAGKGLALKDSEFVVDFSATQARVFGGCQLGHSIRSIAQDGNVICEPEGSKYDAGSGIELKNNAFSIAEQGVNTNHLSDSGITSPKIADNTIQGKDVADGALGLREMAQLLLANTGFGSDITVPANGCTTAGRGFGNAVQLGDLVFIEPTDPDDTLNSHRVFVVPGMVSFNHSFGRAANVLLCTSQNSSQTIPASQTFNWYVIRRN